MESSGGHFLFALAFSRGLIEANKITAGDATDAPSA
jgi:hypothetical protein